MGKIDAGVLRWSRASYPAPFGTAVAGRSWQPLGDAAGLTQFGVNLMRIEPGAASSARHWHEQEDELVYMIQGELILIDNDGETTMRPGDTAGFKAGGANGHHLINRTDHDALFLVVGTRAARERCHYPDIDLAYEYDNGRYRYTRKSGVPYGDWQHD